MLTPEWALDPLPPMTGAAARTFVVGGATGFIGAHLVRRLLARGDRVIVVTRRPRHALARFGPQVTILTAPEALPAATQVDGIVSLAGAPILHTPWTRGRRALLLHSRVATVGALAALSQRLERPPAAFVAASAIGYYGVRGDEALDEGAGGTEDFQSQLVQRWEAAAGAAQRAGTRAVMLRFGVVLGRDGGALAQLARPVRAFAGTILGSGAQWVSWIHIEDLIALLLFGLDEPRASGVFNAVAPGAVRHATLQRELARVLHRPLWFRVPAGLVRLTLGEMAQLLVDGQRVVPARALAVGFPFRFPELRAALEDLYGVPGR